MLVVRMSELWGWKAGERWDPQPVIVHEPQLLLPDEDVPVLKIAVGNASGLEIAHHLEDSFGKLVQLDRLREMPTHVIVQALALDPVHLEDWIPAPLNVD